MGKICFDILLLVSTSVFWIIISYLLRDRIKKYWLYTVFGYLAYLSTLYTLMYRYSSLTNPSFIDEVIITLTVITTIILIIRIVSGKHDFRDTLIFPQIINILALITLIRHLLEA